MIDKENMTVTCDMCGRTEKIDQSPCNYHGFETGENGTRFETVRGLERYESVCERCYIGNDEKKEEIRS
uniref:Uncharacterized protein n=1 Tax=viral metagenome TaxID=1070528 RepID=A0A6M3XUG2_9ZZZZ